MKMMMRFVYASGVLLLALSFSPSANAQPAPSPSPSASPPASPAPSASPAASATPRPVGRTVWSGSLQSTFITQSASGPGLAPAEAATFIAGNPLSPNTPYDTLTSAPLINGNAATMQLFLNPVYTARTFTLGATLAAGYVRGSTTTASYWSENLIPALNPHLGSQALPYRIVFPDHPGQDDGTALRGSVVAARLANVDESAVLRAGWFDLTQSDRFVFVQPAVTNALPAIGAVTAETLGNGTPSLDAWSPSSTILPLHGVDAVFKRGIATLELTDAALPSLPGTGARLTMGSLVFDHGEGTRLSAQLAHIVTGGDLIGTTILYGGAPAAIFTTPQGPLPSSTIGGQRQWVGGLRAAFHATRALDAVAEFGHATYDADHVAQPGTAKPGNFYHAGVSRHIGRVTASLDGYRNEPRYATVLLPYGIPENVWSVAWSWPGQWLKSNYQIMDDSVANIDRQGYRVKYAVDGGALEVHAIYANFGQIEPIALTNALSTGFIDGFFLPQLDRAATYGRQHQYGLWAAWHPGPVDVTFDYAEDTMRRPALPGAAQDNVGYDAPEFVLTVARKISSRALVSLGGSRYAMRGSFGLGSTNIDYAQRQVIAGFQLATGPRTVTQFALRRWWFDGLPTSLAAPPAAFTATQATLETRIKL